MFQLLQLFFILVVVFILNDHLLVTTSASFYNCSHSSFDCPNDEVIGYPFYWENPDSEYDCGYPGLSAKCSQEGRPFISISNHSYYYQPRTIQGKGGFRLKDIDTAYQKCPQPTQNFSVASSSSLLFGDNVTFFYNCTTLPKGVTPNLPCIDQTNNYSGHSFAVSDYDFVEEFNWYDNCQEKVILPMADHSNGRNYSDVIKSGILLYLKPSDDCQNCEISGGMCSTKRNSNTFNCICEGTLFHKICPDSSIGLSRGFFVGVGVGGSLLILLVGYIRRRSETTPTRSVNRYRSLVRVGF